MQPTPPMGFHLNPNATSSGMYAGSKKQIREEISNLIESINKYDNMIYINRINCALAAKIKELVHQQDCTSEEKKQRLELIAKVLVKTDDATITQLIANVDQYHDKTHLDKIRGELHNHLSSITHDRSMSDEEKRNALRVIMSVLWPIAGSSSQ